MSARTQQERVETVRGYPYIRIKGGRLLGFWEAVTAAESAHTALGTALSRSIKLAVASGELSSYYLESVEMRLDRIDEHVAALRHYLDKLRGEQSVRDRIAMLRNTTGRTPEEAALYIAKADKLESALGPGS